MTCLFAAPAYEDEDDVFNDSEDAFGDSSDRHLGYAGLDRSSTAEDSEDVIGGGEGEGGPAVPDEMAAKGDGDASAVDDKAEKDEEDAVEAEAEKIDPAETKVIPFRYHGNPIQPRQRFPPSWLFD